MILAFCEEPEILNLILFLRSVVEVICIVVPIVLILMISIQLFKIVFDSSDSNLKIATKGIINKILASVIIFFVPVLVNLMLGSLGENRVQQTACWTNANSETITYYKKIKEAKQLAERKEKQERIAENNKKREEEDKKRKKSIKKRTSSSGGGKTLLETALKEVGNGHKKYTDWYGWPDEWCCMFVVWATAHTSVNGNVSECANTGRSGSEKCYYNKLIKEDAAAVWYFAYWMAQNKRFYHSQYWANSTGTYKDGSKAYTPQPGDLVFFNGNPAYGVYHGNPLTCDGELGHIAIVKEVKDGQLYWVGGNQGAGSFESSSVTINNCDIGAEKIVGYGTWPKN